MKHEMPESAIENFISGAFSMIGMEIEEDLEKNAVRNPKKEFSVA